MLATITLGACSSSGSSSHAAKGQAPVDRSNWPAQTPASGLAKGLALPLEAYMTAYADQVTVDTALRTLQTRCMSEYGFTVDLPRPGVNPPASSNSINIERRYGITDRAQAKRYGYLLPPELRKHTDQELPDLPDVQVEVLTGHTKPEPVAAPTGGDGSYFGASEKTEPARAEHNGKKLHKGGCIGWSQQQLKLDELDAGFVSQLASRSLSDSRPAKPVDKAITDWSACMKAKGHKAADPFRAMEQGLADGDGDHATKNAIALASDDLDCKKQTRLIKVWFQEESAVQKRLIKENKDRLAAVKARMSEILAAAKAVK
ncbi:hypothetical protein [Streptomyces mesophilus]|uniref:hypothetical protein n=1 Tax=Streptomyces mesophilus TaxID=1775132 RepID=UPI0033293676